VAGVDRSRRVAGAAAHDQRQGRVAVLQHVGVRGEPLAHRPARTASVPALIAEFEPPPGPVSMAARSTSTRCARGSCRRLLVRRSTLPGDPMPTHGATEYDQFVASADWLADACHFLALQDAVPGRPVVGLGRTAPDVGDPAAVVSIGRPCSRPRSSSGRCSSSSPSGSGGSSAAAANDAGILVLGDIPIYVAPDSADVWVQPGSVRARR
jgi:hypothetical protein